MCPAGHVKNRGTPGLPSSPFWRAACDLHCQTESSASPPLLPLPPGSEDPWPEERSKSAYTPLGVLFVEILRKLHGLHSIGARHHCQAAQNVKHNTVLQRFSRLELAYSNMDVDPPYTAACSGAPRP